LSDEDGWVYLGDLGNLIQKKQPNFDSRNYGFEKLTALIRSLKEFEIEQRDNPKSRHKLMFVRNIEIAKKTTRAPRKNAKSTPKKTAAKK
jgi:hypothetical protein